MPNFKRIVGLTNQAGTKARGKTIYERRRDRQNEIARNVAAYRDKINANR
jgi:hypothetical protein